MAYRGYRYSSVWFTVKENDLKPYVILKDYACPKRGHRFDPASGLILGPSEDTAHGFIQLPEKPEKRAMAVYIADGYLWFQYANRRWDLSAPGFVCEVRFESGTRIFEIRSPDSVKFVLPDTTAETLNAGSWSFQEQDEAESSVLPLLVANHYRDPAWRSGVMSAWIKGF